MDSMALTLCDSIVFIETEISFCVSPSSSQKERIASGANPFERNAAIVGRRGRPIQNSAPASISERIALVEKPPNS